MSQFVLSCCSTADMPKTYYEERNIRVIFFRFYLNGVAHKDDGVDIPLEGFYRLMDSGSEPTTSQVNKEEYLDLFDSLLSEGKDVLHLGFSSGLSGSVEAAYLAAEEVNAKYTANRVVVVDTLAASAGYGLLIDGAADLRDANKSLDDVAAWVEENKLRLHHWFFTAELKHFRRGGRVSAASAIVGSILNICPLLNVSFEGKLIPRFKVRGKKNVILKTVEQMKKHAVNGIDYYDKVFISNAACLDDAEELASQVKAAFPNVKNVLITDIGTVIGSHTGPGCTALFFWGDKRTD